MFSEMGRGIPGTGGLCQGLTVQVFESQGEIVWLLPNNYPSFGHAPGGDLRPSSWTSTRRNSEPSLCLDLEALSMVSP